MQRTIEYYNNYFKSQILNNMINNKDSLEQTYLKLLEEIKLEKIDQESKNHFSRNVEKAYRRSYGEIFGMEE